MRISLEDDTDSSEVEQGEKLKWSVVRMVFCGLDMIAMNGTQCMFGIRCVDGNLL